MTSQTTNKVPVPEQVPADGQATIDYLCQRIAAGERESAVTVGRAATIVALLNEANERIAALTTQNEALSEQLEDHLKTTTEKSTTEKA